METMTAGPTRATGPVVDEEWPTERATLAEDVLDGLTRPFKELPPRCLYDARGSELFDEICEQPEYYQSRAERLILEARAGEIVADSGACELLELGAGSATKTHMLLDAMLARRVPVRYLPLDVCASAMERAVAALAERYPQLLVTPLVGDFERAWDVGGSPGPRLVASLGGTLGNFMPGSRRRFLRGLAATLDERDHVLMGVDLVKDRDELVAAYNDAAGVTAAFNVNVLAVINRRLSADFDLENFTHVARYDDRRDWIEMRLRARDACVVEIRSLGLTVDFTAGEEMRTEISAKFTRERIRADLGASGLVERGWYTDARERFALVLCQATSNGGYPDDI